MANVDTLAGFIVTLTFLMSQPSCFVADDNFNSTESFGVNMCDPGYVILYKMVLKTHWTEESFPKSYPKWRPPAQWSTVFGQTHDNDHGIFSLGKPSSSQLAKFVERSDLYEISMWKERESIFDQFTAQAIKQGAGETLQYFFVTANHSRLSMVCKIIPSPDWFIGLNGYELCKDGQWTDETDIALNPLDGGTQGGLTFTAPRWRLQEPDEIVQITSQYPSHRAGSFYYPDLNELPIIASLHLEKINEYFLEEDPNSVMENLNDTDTNLVQNKINTNQAIELNLRKEADDLLNNITSHYQQNEEYFPKYFRNIDYNLKIKQSKKATTSGNLQISMLPSTKSKTGSSYFSW